MAEERKIREEQESNKQKILENQKQINMTKVRKARRQGISVGSTKDAGSKPSVFGKNKDSVLS